ncbi:MAG TPA: glycosyltransferase family 4 protein [Gemmataceae bacterium]|nr:glycosyltransferase family 4 protein [Gemmataceae bacterium]
MKIAYLTNQYPHVRHTFIRREIVALERLGVPVERFSIRDTGADAVDPADRAEHAKTRALLSAGKLVLLATFLTHAMTRPNRFLRAVRCAIRLGRRSDRGVLRHLAYLAEGCLLRKWLSGAGVTHLHVHFATNPAAVALFCRLLGGPSYSITVHGPEEWDRPEALSLKEKYENAAFVVAVTDFGRCQVYRWTSLTFWPRIHVVRCGVDEAFLKSDPEPVRPTDKLVLVAGLVEQKGHLLLIQALARVKQAGVTFQMFFIGDGHLRPILEAEVKRLGLMDNVEFAGWQSNAEVREHLRTARALVMPSFAENLPVAMMEALATGRPVLGTYIAGVPELVENGVNGWLVPAGNVDATADAILRILRTPPAELTRMGRAGAEVIRARHDAAKESAKMRDLFAAVTPASR